MSTKRIAAWFGSKESHPQPVPSPPSSPLPGRNPDIHGGEERIMSPEELQQSVESLELVLRTKDVVRDQTNRQNTALIDHARSLREYAVNINMMATFDDKAHKRNIGEDKVFENLVVHCANYYDRLAEAQELFVSDFLLSLLISGKEIFGRVQYVEQSRSEAFQETRSRQCKTRCKFKGVNKEVIEI